jgi:steroid 5-alpha reductase family enzyme
MEPLLVSLGIYFCLVIILATGMFMLMQLKHDNSLIDIAYGPLFFVSALLALWLTKTTALLPLVITLATGIWAFRLARRIFIKNWGKPEDVRYAAWREAWLKKGELYFMLRSYAQINLLQGILIVLISFPFIIALTHGTTFSLPFLIVGVLVFFIGLTIETIADMQLDKFLKRKKDGTETATLLTTGLFRYSRRPNYFGETLIWWGFAIMVLPLPYGFLGLISPLTITYIVTKITGPMLENIFLNKYGDLYRDYMRTTSYFIPFPPKK